MKIAALTVCLMLALPAIAPAQAPRPPPSGDTETIYDYGQRTRDNELATRFLKSLVRPSNLFEGEYAMWRSPICPHVEGMAFPDAYFVERRIGDIARKVGAPVDRKTRCVPNVIIFVSSDPQLVLNTMKAKKPFLFAGAPRSELKIHYPVQAWYYVLDVDYNGHSWPDMPWDTYSMDPPQTSACFPPHLKTCIQPELSTAIILVNSAAIRDLTLDSFADYAALMSLSQAPATGHCQPAASIANLFLTNCEAGVHVSILSDIDLAMLTSLYETRDAPEKLQLSRLTSHMGRNLEQGGGK